MPDIATARRLSPDLEERIAALRAEGRVMVSPRKIAWLLGSRDPYQFNVMALTGKMAWAHQFHGRRLLISLPSVVAWIYGATEQEAAG